MRIPAVVFALLLVGGCAHGGVKPAAQPAKPVDPIVQAKKDFKEKYGFLITRREKVTFYQESLGVTDKENKIFESLKTVEDIHKFTEVFWKVRDIDRGTPENEYKMLIDSRIEDIKNEIFFRDPVIPGLRFDRHGGVTGDLAHVFLIHGRPYFREKLPENQHHAELMVWYYLDQNGEHLFRFLFINKYGSYKLFKNYLPILDISYLIDPMLSPLRDISIKLAPTAQELYDLWNSLIYIEPARAFVLALLEFSHYSGDIVIEGGNGKDKFGALDPPEPAFLTAERYKPRIIGEPDDLSGKNMSFGKYHSFVPAYVRLTKTADGNPSLSFIIAYSNLDWELKDGKAECKLALRVNVLNKVTTKSMEFSTVITVSLANADEVKATKSVYVLVDNANGVTGGGSKPMKFRDFVKDLSAGEYIMDTDFVDLRTMKSGISIQEFNK